MHKQVVFLLFFLSLFACKLTNSSSLDETNSPLNDVQNISMVQRMTESFVDAGFSTDYNGVKGWFSKYFETDTGLWNKTQIVRNPLSSQAQVEKLKAIMRIRVDDSSSVHERVLIWKLDSYYAPNLVRHLKILADQKFFNHDEEFLEEQEKGELTENSPFCKKSIFHDILCMNAQSFIAKNIQFESHDMTKLMSIGFRWAPYYLKAENNVIVDRKNQDPNGKVEIGAGDLVVPVFSISAVRSPWLREALASKLIINHHDNLEGWTSEVVGNGTKILPPCLVGKYEGQVPVQELQQILKDAYEGKVVIRVADFKVQSVGTEPLQHSVFFRPNLPTLSDELHPEF